MASSPDWSTFSDLDVPLLGDDEHVSGGLGVDVLEGQQLVVFEDDLCQESRGG